ncbi:hypothetical protein [Turneriella parva]|uniref:Uncharacterized protein n=1 Tax=Turneriella parva (strain ATCC BAA-1111 / DSM 21527 / NCTC 11395 / H) TaxID=869212 RepID=I4BAS2_TURPD|nr:hypothetical protein [Turneriella parva]AFM14379.1 hypothetical protein Turpa_3745 [Turneriella parva DSM 21527]
MYTQDIECSECHEKVGINVARIVEDDSFDNGMETCRYLCPVCAIQAKNRLMQVQLMAARAT